MIQFGLHFEHHTKGRTRTMSVLICKFIHKLPTQFYAKIDPSLPSTTLKLIRWSNDRIKARQTEIEIVFWNGARGKVDWKNNEKLRRPMKLISV